VETKPKPLAPHYHRAEYKGILLEDPVVPVIDGRPIGHLYTQTGWQLQERYSLDQILKLTQFVSTFTQQQEYMATKSVSELWPYIHGSSSFPWVTGTYQEPEILAFSKLNPWDLSKVGEVHGGQNHNFFSKISGQVMEVSTFFVNPCNRPEYKGLGRTYIHQVLRAAHAKYSDSIFIAVVQAQNDAAYHYFQSIGGQEVCHFWYTHSLAEGVKGEKVLFNLTSVARAVSSDHSSTH
jgi:hypothetical protein